MTMNLSEYSGSKVFRNYEGFPYMINVRCKIDDTYALISLEKYEDIWRCHFVEHASESCEYCGNVQLYSKCWRLTDLIRDNYGQFIDWMRTQK